MEKTAAHMERVRAALGNKSIHVNSFYRSPAVNAAVGSKSTSQHLLGEAVDFICPAFGTPVEICRKLIELHDLIRFDQLILEHSWVHISFTVTLALTEVKCYPYSQQVDTLMDLLTRKEISYERSRRDIK